MSVPDGSNHGTTTIPAYRDEYTKRAWGARTIAENEITIIVPPYGDGSGGIVFGWQGEPVTVPGESCVYTFNLYSTDELSGHLTETGGTIDINDDWTSANIRSGCPGDSETSEYSTAWQTTASVIDNRVIRGEVMEYFESSFTFEATKR